MRLLLMLVLAACGTATTTTDPSIVVCTQSGLEPFSSNGCFWSVRECSDGNRYAGSCSNDSRLQGNNCNCVLNGNTVKKSPADPNDPWKTFRSTTFCNDSDEDRRQTLRTVCGFPI